jgi:hypothetical protein
MARHRVEAGETLYTIAQRYGLDDWRAIYDHPDNAALWGRRSNPQVLHPGDLLQIPDDVRAGVPVALDRRTTLVRREAGQQPLTLMMENLDGTPMRQIAYELQFAGGARRGHTDESGKIAVEIPIGAREATLTVGDHRWRLEVGSLNPLESTDDHGVSGCQGRLTNLGYFRGQIDGRDGPELQDAIGRFQLDHNLPCTGRLDDATWRALDERHGC